MPTYYDHKGEATRLTNSISRGGEGEVWSTDRTSTLNGVKRELVAKIYHNNSGERFERMSQMLSHRPEDPTITQGHISLAWITHTLFDDNRNFVFFLMPRIGQSVDLTHVYNPQKRQEYLPGFNWQYLHVTALNLALVVHSLHSKGYIIGDIKPQNILVDNRARISIIDCDSFQVRITKNGNEEKVYRCPVGSEGFTPPELIGQELAEVTQIEAHDNFRLAVIIFYLLFGSHPFDIGTWEGKGPCPNQSELIRSGYWLYGKSSPIRSNETSIPLDIVHPEVANLFRKCFNDGYNNPNSRPTAKDWHDTLNIARDWLEKCNTIDTHIYSKTYKQCYWCKRSKKLGVDVFSGSQAGARPVKTSTTTQLVKLILFLVSLGLGAFSIASGQLWLLFFAILLFLSSFLN